MRLGEVMLEPDYLEAVALYIWIPYHYKPNEQVQLRDG